MRRSSQSKRKGDVTARIEPREDPDVIRELYEKYALAGDVVIPGAASREVEAMGAELERAAKTCASTGVEAKPPGPRGGTPP